MSGWDQVVAKAVSSWGKVSTKPVNGQGAYGAATFHQRLSIDVGSQPTSCHQTAYPPWHCQIRVSLLPLTVPKYRLGHERAGNLGVSLGSEGLKLLGERVVYAAQFPQTVIVPSTREDVEQDRGGRQEGAWKWEAKNDKKFFVIKSYDPVAKSSCRCSGL
ncbi:hypothetical protein C8R43DRAFT_956077 [Mycena crocata]|nr:hypothetical protein C8R43DRAFT_956077 [Mycena crocata]